MEKEIKALKKWYLEKYGYELLDKAAENIVLITYRYGSQIFGVAYDLIMSGKTNESGIEVEVEK